MSDNATAPPHVEERSFLTIDRRIPVPWLVSGSAAIAVGIGGLFVQQQRTAEQSTSIAADVREIKAEVHRQTAKAMEDNFTVRDLSRRVTVLEAAQQARESVNSVKK